MKTLKELASDLRNGALTATDLTEHIYTDIAAKDPQIKAFISLNKEVALEAAAKADASLKKGAEVGLLTGIPIAIKDNICLSGTKTTCASKMLEDFVAPYDATVIRKLAEAGAVPIGKANMDEFAMGSSTENSAFFPTKNPWDLSKAPGGSSGGSAAAVAARMVPGSLGSDTGGSIRQPAAFCGILGLKPTYGRVSRYGLVAFASSLDQIGPFTVHAEDAALIMNAISGHDPKDSTSAKIAVPDFTATLHHELKGLRIGVPKQLLGDAIQPEVKQAVIQALDLLKAQGATWQEISMDSFDLGLSTYYIIAPAEASSNLARYDGVRYGHRTESAQDLTSMYKKTRGEGFGPEVKRRIILGTFVLSSGYYDAYYLKAQKAKALITEDFNKTFETVDVIMSPTAPTTAFGLGDNTQDPLSMYLADIATIPVNLAGLPGLSIPCGFSKGLPIGLQLIGKAWDEARLLNIAHQYQSLTSYHLETPHGI
ncbi:MAG: Asp-tRNA(Asn)/Glu-tRNA(Gln) amidotransferase subunit GatA [Candidatus Margulisiibacteriota bacterium]